MAATISYTFSEIAGFEVGFQFEDESLHHYQKRASQRLTTILEGLDLGAPANLGFTRVLWLPDHIARVRFLVMEGILEPIITVKIEFQEGFKVPAIPLTQLQIKEEFTEEEPYEPYLWVGIASINHVKGAGDQDNPSCGYWGHPVEGRLVGFEPHSAKPSHNPDEFPLYGWNNCVESFDGFDWRAAWPLIVDAAYGSGYGAEDASTHFFVNNGQEWGGPGDNYSELLSDDGYFADGAWLLSNSGEVNGCYSGMIATEHCDTLVTAPAEAYVDAISGDAERPGYWQRSIIVDPEGHEFPEGLVSNDLMPVLPLQEVITLTTSYGSGALIPCFVMRGKYEIQCFAENYTCECNSCQLHIRMVIGRGDGATIVDFIVDELGTSFSNCRNSSFNKETTLGGTPGHPEEGGLCGTETIDNFWGDNDGGGGWWPSSIFVDVELGTFEISAGTRRFPFFGNACASAEIVGPEHPACLGCVGEDTESPAGNLDGAIFPNRINYTFSDGTGEFGRDGRMGVIWHLARVMQVDNITGYICRIKIVGNDGGDGGSCSETGCQTWAWGTNIWATGIDPNLPLGTNLQEIPNNGRVPYTVGELVAIVGFTDTHTNEKFCKIAGGDWRAIVTRTNGAGQDFTHISWWELRCPKFFPVEHFFEGLITAMENQVICKQDGGTAPLPREIECDCDSGQFRCKNKE